MTPEEFDKSALPDIPANRSESAKYRLLTLPYIHGNVIDLGSGGWPVVPHAIQIELPEDKFAWYNSGNKPETPIQWRGTAFDLPFKDGTVDTVFSSHLLEDVEKWTPVLKEWVRVLKRGGILIILIPDKRLWNDALRKGQPPNNEHRHEGAVGELTTYASALGLVVLEDRLTDCFPGDYSILFVGKKP